MNKSTITIEVDMDENRIPAGINWQASDSTLKSVQKAKAMMLAFWDNHEKTALRIDLWTKDMMVDEMADFFYQAFMTMADTYGRATNQQPVVDTMKKFAADFYKQARATEE